MATNRKTGALPKHPQDLKKKNAALKKQVKELRAERDSYLLALHAWAKKRISRDAVRNLMAEEKLEGSLMQFIDEVEQGNS
jgi:hypothetical protein